MIAAWSEVWRRTDENLTHQGVSWIHSNSFHLIDVCMNNALLSAWGERTCDRRAVLTPRAFHLDQERPPDPCQRPPLLSVHLRVPRERLANFGFRTPDELGDIHEPPPATPRTRWLSARWPVMRRSPTSTHAAITRTGRTTSPLGLSRDCTFDRAAGLCASRWPGFRLNGLPRHAPTAGEFRLISISIPPPKLQGVRWARSGGWELDAPSAGA
jgi:hypothetical protein